MNKFIFHGVGQGLFYSGRLKDGAYHFVFDCGSESMEKFLFNAIDNHMTKEDIDFVLISHLHKDHVHGLERLLAKNNVKKLYLPYLGKGNLNLVKLLIAYSYLESEEEYEQLFDTIDYISSFYGGNKDFERTYKVDFLGSNGEESHEDGTIFTVDFLYASDHNGPYWEFIMFNKRQPDSVLAHLDREISLLLQKNNVKDVLDLVRAGNKADLVKIYKYIFQRKGKTLNLTSTVLIHYPTADLRILFPMTCECFLKSQISDLKRKPITVLTGDAEFDSEMLRKMHNRLLSHLDPFVIFQVPHHGALKNWNLLSTQYKYAFSHYVISYGLGNKHKHPHQSVISELSIQKVDAISLVNQMNTFFHYIN